MAHGAAARPVWCTPTSWGEHATDLPGGSRLDARSRSGLRRYGGHTSCVAITRDGDAAPTLALDAGTGIRSLTGLLGGSPFRGSILLSHLHWDHMQGIPFFAAGDREDAVVDVHVPDEDGRSARDLVARTMSPPGFPITPEGLKGRWTFHPAAPGPVEVPGFEVTAFEVAHKGGRTFGYRVSDGASSVAYVPDHAPAIGVSHEALAVLAGVDVLIHDAQFLAEERPRAVDYGHATVDEAIALAQRASVGTLVLFHHGPHRTDPGLDRIAQDFAAHGRCWWRAREWPWSCRDDEPRGVACARRGGHRRKGRELARLRELIERCCVLGHALAVLPVVVVAREGQPDWVRRRRASPRPEERGGLLRSQAGEQDSGQLVGTAELGPVPTGQVDEGQVAHGRQLPDPGVSLSIHARSIPTGYSQAITVVGTS